MASLPAELVFKILDGCSLSDILSFTRVCSFWRQLSVNCRLLWLSSSDVHKLPLPRGKTLKTLEVYLFPRYAARVIALGEKWAPDACLSPLRTAVIPISKEFPSYGFETFCHILPGRQLYLYIASCPATRMHLYNFSGEYCCDMGLLGSSRAVAWDSADNGLHITVICETLLEPSFKRHLSIYMIKQPWDSESVIVDTWNVPLPDRFYTSCVSVKNGHAVVGGTNGFILLKVKDRLGCFFEQTDPENEDFAIVKADLHPSLPVIFVDVQKLDDDHIILEYVGIPPETDLLPVNMDDSEYIWPSLPFSRTTIATTIEAKDAYLYSEAYDRLVQVTDSCIHIIYVKSALYRVAIHTVSLCGVTLAPLSTGERVLETSVRHTSRVFRLKSTTDWPTVVMFDRGQDQGSLSVLYSFALGEEDGVLCDRRRQTVLKLPPFSIPLAFDDVAGQMVIMWKGKPHLMHF